MLTPRRLHASGPTETNRFVPFATQTLQVRADVWLPSLQECRGSTRLSNWLFTGADAVGALAGPLMYAATVAPGAAGAMPFLSPKALFHFSAVLGVALCASTHIFI